MNSLRGKRVRKARQIPLPLGPGTTNQRARRCDTVLLIAVLALLCMGVIMVYSSGALIAWERYKDPFLFLKKKTIFTILGLIIMLLLMRWDYRKLRYLTLPLMLSSIAMLVAVFIPGIGIKAGHATRWISIWGVTFQPSELAKLSLIFYFSHILVKKRDRLREFCLGYLPMVLVLAIFCLLVLLERDLGSALLMAAVVFIMFFVGGVPLRFTGSTVLASLLPLYITISGTEYWWRRILTFFNPWNDPLDSGFQTIQSFMALGRGGILGLGLGEGKQKLFYLPEPHSDFIFSVIGEELGFMGTITIVVLFLIIVWRGLRVSSRCPDLYGTYLAFGISALVGIQALVHMSVATGLMPAKGLTLPFISSGGSSLLVSMMAVGVLLNISKRSSLKRG